MILDTNVSYRHFMRELLMSRFPHLRVEEASSGREGLMKLRGCNPDMVFLEHYLPGSDVPELVRHVKAVSSEPVVVILSNYNLPEYRTAAEQLGADHFIARDECTGSLLVELVNNSMRVRLPHS